PPSKGRSKASAAVAACLPARSRNRPPPRCPPHGQRRPCGSSRRRIGHCATAISQHSAVTGASSRSCSGAPLSSRRLPISQLAAPGANGMISPLERGGTRTIVVALGGNALQPPGGHGGIHEQFAHTRESLGVIVALAKAGWRVAVVHGNGPQIGDELLRNELARSRRPP